MMTPSCTSTRSNPTGLSDSDLQESFAVSKIAESATVFTVPTEGIPSWIRRTVPQLLRLSSLNVNWDSYGGIAPSLEKLEAVIDLLCYTEIDTFPEPVVVPGSNGEIQLEWYLGNRELEIEFGSTGRLEFLRTDNESGSEDEGVVEDLDTLRRLLMWVVGKA